MQYIDAHPELAEQGFQIRNAVDVSCSQKKVAYVRQDAQRVRRRARRAHDRGGAHRAAQLPPAVQGQRQDVAGHGGRGQPRRRRRRLPGPAVATSRSTTAAAASRASAAATRRAPARASRPSSSRPASTTTASRSTCSCSAAPGTTTSSSAWPTRSRCSRTRTARATSRPTTAPRADLRQRDHGRRRRHRARDALAHAGRAGDVRRVHARRREGVHGADRRDDRLHRGRRGADRRATPAISPTARSRCRSRCRSASRRTRGATPVSNVKSTIAFKQAIGASDALRTGSYSKTLTFTLSTTNP